MITSGFRLTEVMRKLARANYWQIIYSQAKEANGLQMFNNTSDFTGLQLDFLNEVSFFASIMFEISLGEVDEVILKDDIYCEAYAFYRNKQKRKTKKNSRPISPGTTKTVEKESNEQVLNQNQWVFTKVKGK